MNKNLRLSLLVILSLIIFIIIYYNNFHGRNIVTTSSGKSKHDFVISGKANIIDGDSLKIKGYEMRLLDLDAPEYKQYCQDANNDKYACGKESMAYLKRLAKDATLDCYISGRDYYNRLLATCFKGKLNINSKLVESGWAIRYNNESNYYKAEQKAKADKTGIWQGKFITPKQYRRLNPRK